MRKHTKVISTALMAAGMFVATEGLTIAQQNPTTNPSTNQSTTQSTNQTTTQDANKTTNQTTTQDPSKTTDQTTNQDANRTTSQDANQTNQTPTTTQTQDSNRSTSQDMNTPAGAKVGEKMTVSSSDMKFMQMAAMGGMAEVQMARMAVEKSSNATIKEYAQKMIDDHTKAGDELKQVASTKGITLPMSLDAKHQAKMAKLQRASGAEFDRMYVKEAAVKSHEAMEKLYTRESTDGKDADARGFAAKTLPTVQMHLRMGRDLMSNMNGMKGMSDKKTGTSTM